MTNYAKLSQKPQLFHTLTGSTLEEFHALLPAFETSFLEYMRDFTLDGQPRQKRTFTSYLSFAIKPRRLPSSKKAVKHNLASLNREPGLCLKIWPSNTK